MDDPLQFLPMEKWTELQKVFEKDWPRGISAYTALETQKRINELGLGYGFRVYCPYGDVNNGMVALNKKETFNEIMIQCPEDDTSKLESALVSTKLIDWAQGVVVPCLPDHTYQSVMRVVKKLNLEADEEELHPPHELVLLDKNKPFFENISIPEGVTFQPILEEHLDIVDEAWLNRYDSSKWLFRLFLKANSGYGLFHNNALASCVFLNEHGALTHLYTFDNHKRKGYGKILMELVCNVQLKQKKNTFGYCMRGNTAALRLYESLGFHKHHHVRWCIIDPKNS